MLALTTLFTRHHHMQANIRPIKQYLFFFFFYFNINIAQFKDNSC